MTHCHLMSGTQLAGIVVGEEVGTNLLVMRTEVQHLSFCILMALNVVFSNVWGIILKEWKGCSSKTITVLIVASHVGHHAVRPVQHRGFYEDQLLAVADIQRVAGFHGVEVPLRMVVVAVD